METKINRVNITNHLIQYQLNLVGKTIKDTIDDDLWYFNWTITTEQFTEFKNYSIPLIKKTFKCNKARAEATFNWFNLSFGLRIKN